MKKAPAVNPGVGPYTIVVFPDWGCVGKGRPDMEKMFELDGEGLDLDALVTLFPDGPATVQKYSERYCLKVFNVSSDQDQDQAMSDAQTILARMNAIAMLTYADHRPAKVKGTTNRDPETGELKTLVPMKASVSARSRVVANISVTMPAGEGIPDAPTPIGQGMLRLAAKKEQFETALFIYGSVKHSWHGLYLVYDAIKLGNGGKEDDLKAKNFAPSSSIKDFTATANSYAAVGLDARHGPQSAQVQVPKMTLEEARTLIRTLLNAWARELRQGEAS